MINFVQASVGTGPTFICTTPNGSFQLTLLVGTASSVTLGVKGNTTGGAVIPANGNLTLVGYRDSHGQDIYGTAAATTIVSYALCVNS
jgi:hypothetical protein